jgi:glycerophosphoryl diester phosphodiesterase
VPEVPEVTTVRRVGHKGASLIAPGNTLASFDAALAAGVDMIEFDILPDRDTGELILAHDPGAARRGNPPTLDQGLTHLASPAFEGLDFDVDLKGPGYEDRVVEALRSHGLIERSLVCSQYPRSLDRVRELDPSIRLGWSVPRASTDYTTTPLLGWLAVAALLVYRRLLPRRASRALRSGRVDAIMANWRIVTPRLVDAVRAAGGDLYAWTVDDAARIRTLAGLGVTGVISNDPRLFSALAA